MDNEEDGGLGNIQISPLGSSQPSPSKGKDAGVESGDPKGSKDFAVELDPERSELLKKGNILYRLLLKMSFEHEKMTPKEWCAKISSSDAFHHSNVTHFCRIQKYELQDSSLFIIADHTESITTHSIRNLSGDKSFSVGSVVPARTYVTLDHLLSPEIPHTKTSQVIISSHVLPESTATTEIAFQLAPTRTAVSGRNFVEHLKGVYLVRQGSVGALALVRPSQLGDDIEWDEWRRVISEMVLKHQDFEISITESMKFLRRSVREHTGVLGKLILKANRALDELRLRFGPSHEFQVRMCLEATRGMKWGKSKKIKGLKDLFLFVARGLSRSEIQTMTACKRLYRSLATGFTGLEYKPEAMALSEVEFENVSVPS